MTLRKKVSKSGQKEWFRIVAKKSRVVTKKNNLEEWPKKNSLEGRPIKEQCRSDQKNSSEEWPERINQKSGQERSDQKKFRTVVKKSRIVVKKSRVVEKKEQWQKRVEQWMKRIEQ